MTQSWLRYAVPIAAIFASRLLGLFMLIPVFTLYAPGLIGATPMLLGIALGCYGLSQGLLQIPFGILSDRYGRKPILTIGLLLFAIGSLFGAYTHSIYGMIFARILQGAGAIGSVLIALLADLTPDEQRTKAMAIIGITMGISFSLAIAISPMIAHHLGLSGIFYITASLALLGLIIIHVLIPTPVNVTLDARMTINSTRFKAVMSNPHLQRLNIGIFFQHLILTSTFFAIPIVVEHHINQGHLSDAWHFYLPLMIMSFLAMLPCIVFAEKKNNRDLVFVASVGATIVAQWLLTFAYHSFFWLCGSMVMYFVAFNILEASLPSLVSKQANINSRGCAMGVYSSSQFLGISAGGALSGLLFQWFGYTGIFIINCSVALVWLLMTLHLKYCTAEPIHATSHCP